jgi:hypothetical protein
MQIARRIHPIINPNEELPVLFPGRYIWNVLFYKRIYPQSKFSLHGIFSLISGAYTDIRG